MWVSIGWWLLRKFLATCIFEREWVSACTELGLILMTKPGCKLLGIALKISRTNQWHRTKRTKIWKEEVQKKRKNPMHPRSEAKCILKRNARAVKRWVKFTSRMRFSNFCFAEKPSQLKRRCHQNTPFSLQRFLPHCSPMNPSLQSQV